MGQEAVVASAVLISVGVISFFWMWKRMKSRNVKYVKVGKIAKLFFYPVKSLRGMEIENAECTKIGLKVDSVPDRSFMIATEKGNLVSQRQEPRLALLTPSIRFPNLFIDGPGLPTLKVHIKTVASSKDKVSYCRLFGKDVETIDCGDEAALWIQKYLEKPGLRLMQHLIDMPHRASDNEFNLKNAEGKYPIALQDATPYLLLSQSSIDDLNTRLEKKVSARNFRPNFLAVDCQPHDEDSWKHVKLSSGAKLIFLKYCDRCIMTTVDPDTGIKDNVQPLETLRKYRLYTHLNRSPMYKNAPLFGIHHGVEQEGKVRVGDEIFVMIEN